MSASGYPTSLGVSTEATISLLGEDQSPRMAVEERRLQLPFEGADLTADG